MPRFGIPNDYVSDPVGSDAAAEGRIMIERDAADAAGTYTVQATELHFAGERRIAFRFVATTPVDPPGPLLGWLATRYETSGRGSATVSPGGDAGGVSYGAFQLTSRDSDGSVGGNVARFLASEGAPFAADFSGLDAGSPGFSAAWMALAAAQPAALFDAEHAFIRRTHYGPQLQRILVATGLDVTRRTRGLAEAVFSTAVQHGPNTSLVVQAIDAVEGAQIHRDSGKQFDAAVIEALYTARETRNPSLARRYRGEKQDALLLVDPVTEEQLAAHVAAGTPAGQDPVFAQWFAAHVGPLANFTPSEFLTLGAGNEASGLNTPPPEALWENLVPLARLLQEIRNRMGSAVRLHSVYRNAAYNAAVGGERDSQHLLFRAADFSVPGVTSPEHWASVARECRQQGMFRGGIGLYATFVHVDTRGWDADWMGR